MGLFILHNCWVTCSFACWSLKVVFLFQRFLVITVKCTTMELKFKRNYKTLSSVYPIVYPNEHIWEVSDDFHYFINIIFLTLGMLYVTKNVRDYVKPQTVECTVINLFKIFHLMHLIFESSLNFHVYCNTCKSRKLASRFRPTPPPNRDATSCI